jgi:hypothetical protein
MFIGERACGNKHYIEKEGGLQKSIIVRITEK